MLMMRSGQAPSSTSGHQSDVTGGPDFDRGRAIAVDSSGDIFVAGCYFCAATFGSTTLKGKGNGDIFVARLDRIGKF